MSTKKKTGGPRTAQRNGETGLLVKRSDRKENQVSVHKQCILQRRRRRDWLKPHNLVLPWNQNPLQFSLFFCPTDTPPLPSPTNLLHSASLGVEKRKELILHNVCRWRRRKNERERNIKTGVSLSYFFYHVLYTTKCVQLPSFKQEKENQPGKSVAFPNQ